MSMMESIAQGLTSGLGSLFGGIIGAKTTKDVNAQNIAFQREQNEIERKRADNTLMRTVADAHRAGLSAFDAQAVPLGQTSAPQNDVGAVATSMGSLTQSLADTGANTLNYVLESAKLEHNKNVDDQKLKIADAQASAEVALKNAQTEVANLNAQLQSKQNMTYEERNKIENDLKIAQTKANLANESKMLAETSIAYSKEKREKALHEIEVNTRSLEYQTKIQQFNHNAETYPIIRDMLKNQKKMSDDELLVYAKKLGLEIDNLTIDALRKTFMSESYSSQYFSESYQKQNRKLLKSIKK